VACVTWLAALGLSGNPPFIWLINSLSLEVVRTRRRRPSTPFPLRQQSISVNAGVQSLLRQQQHQHRVVSLGERRRHVAPQCRHVLDVIQQVAIGRRRRVGNDGETEIQRVLTARSKLRRRDTQQAMTLINTSKQKKTLLTY